MDSTQVSEIIFSSFDQKWCEENVPSLEILTKNSKISKSEIQKIKQDFETHYSEYCSLDDEDKSEERVAQLSNVIFGLSNIVSKCEETDLSESEIETKRPFTVCSSSVFKKEEKVYSNWDPSCLVGLDISYNKSFQISPDVRTSIDEQDKSTLNLIYKWRGLKSNVQPISIPLLPDEANELILGAIVMFSIYNPENRNFPVLPTDSKTCQELLEKVDNWSTIGQDVLHSFGISPEIIGSILQQHLNNIVNSSQEVHENVESMKSKRKKEDNVSDIWSKRKKSYLKYLENS